MVNKNLSGPASSAGASPSRTEIILNAPILPTLLRLAAPNVLNFLAFVGVIVFDGYFLGRIGTNALAGASLAFPFVMLVLQTTNSGMGAGVTSAVARALGAGNRDLADELVYHAFLLAVGLGVVFSLLMGMSAPVIFRCMGAQGGMLDDALAYANVALGGAVFITVLNLLGNAVRGTGNMSLHANVLLWCVAAHIALTPLLIFGWGPVPALGPAGAGWGLVIPFAAGSLVMIRYLCSSSALVRLRFRASKPQWELFADILKVGVPGLLNTAITNLSIITLTGIAGQFGPQAAIGYAMGARLEYTMQPIAFGFGTAIVAMVGTNCGARKFDRARQIAWKGALIVAIVCGAIGVTVALIPSLWLDLFSSDPEVAQFGARYLRIAGPAYLFFGLGLGMFFVCQGYALGFTAMNANAARLIWSASAGLVAMHWLDLGVTGFCAAVATGFVLYAALLVLTVTRIKHAP